MGKSCSQRTKLPSDFNKNPKRCAPGAGPSHLHNGQRLTTDANKGNILGSLRRFLQRLLWEDRILQRRCDPVLRQPHPQQLQAGAACQRLHPNLLCQDLHPNLLRQDFHLKLSQPTHLFSTRPNARNRTAQFKPLHPNAAMPHPLRSWRSAEKHPAPEKSPALFRLVRWRKRMRSATGRSD